MGHPSRGWLMTSVAPWGETHEDAFDQGLVELGLGDSRLVEVSRGAMLPMGFEPVMPEPLPMGSIVEAHLAVGYAFDGSTACAGAAWATAVTPEGMHAPSSPPSPRRRPTRTPRCDCVAPSSNDWPPGTSRSQPSTVPSTKSRPLKVTTALPSRRSFSQNR